MTLQTSATPQWEPGTPPRQESWTPPATSPPRSRPTGRSTSPLGTRMPPSKGRFHGRPGSPSHLITKIVVRNTGQTLSLGLLAGILLWSVRWRHPATAQLQRQTPLPGAFEPLREGCGASRWGTPRRMHAPYTPCSFTPVLMCRKLLDQEQTPDCPRASPGHIPPSPHPGT
jgi:hypothetical protein